MKRALACGLVALAALAVAGCKQGVGERCLVDSDCSSGLVCNEAQMLCASPSGELGAIDASVPDAPLDGPPMPDAPPHDGPPADAP